MRTAYSLAAIRNGKIVLVRKGDVWILPGGKPQNGESPAQCLLRECLEELPGSKVKLQRHYGEFKGKTPHTRDQLTATVYFGSISGELRPGSEIAEVQCLSARECNARKLSDITNKIIQSLIKDTLL